MPTCDSPKAADNRPVWDETKRLEALAATGILDTQPEQSFDDLALLAKTICGTPIALISLVDANRQWFKAHAGTDLEQTPLEMSVCALAMRQGGVVEIRDLTVDPRTAAMPIVAGPPHIRFYAGAPLVTSLGYVLGMLCVLDLEPRPDGLSLPQRDALEALARQTMGQIELNTRYARREGALSASQSLGTWDWDIARGVVIADARFARMYGVDPTLAATGAPVQDFFTPIHPDDLERVQAEVDGALASGQPYDVEYRLIRPNGALRWLIAQGRATVDDEGKAVRLSGVSFDVTQRRSAEARTNALLELSDRIRDIIDPEDIAFVASEILGRTLGVSRAGYGTIDKVKETIDIARDWNAPGVESIAGQLRFRDYGSYIEQLKRGETAVIINADEDERTRDTAEALKAISAASFVNMPITEQGGMVALAFVNSAAPRKWREEELTFIREVAERARSAVERRRVEQELAGLNAALEQLVEARTADLLRAEEQLRQSQKMEAVGQLTGGLAHDFNNMLTGISGALEMMQVRVQQGRLTELDRYVTAAQGAASRAAALTHRLLAFSRRQTLDPKPTDVNRLIAGIEDMIRRTAGPGVEVEVVGAGGLWPALVDQNQLENALLNLCINARDAMPEGGRITIETANKWLDARTARERELPPGQYLSLCVTDTGQGMTPEVQARAFDPFFTTKPLGEGTGLGLSMIYGFARQSGGHVRIYSEVGEGTTMCLYLPRHHGAGENAAEAEEAVLAQRAIDGQTVLIVDDEPTIRMLVAEVLEELGYAALEAGDGAAALQILQSDARIDLLITDVGLPGAMNGRQVADAARMARPDLGILFITGYAENAVVGNGQLEPGMALMTKPFAMEALAVRIKDMLEKT